MRKRSHTKALLAYKKFCNEKEFKKYETYKKRQLASKLATLKAKFPQDLSALEAKFRKDPFEAGTCYYTCDGLVPSHDSSDEEFELLLEIRQANI